MEEIPLSPLTTTRNTHDARDAIDYSEVYEHGEHPGTVPLRVTGWTYLYALCAAVNSCNIGYDIGVSTEAGRLIERDLDLTCM